MWLSINVNKIDTFRKTLKEFIEQAASKSLSAVDNNHSPRRFFVVTSSRMISRGTQFRENERPRIVAPLPESLLDRSSRSRETRQYTWMFYRWQSLGTRSCLLSGAPGALMAFWAMLSRYLYARQADWCRLKAKSERSRRDLRDSFIRFSTREAIRVRRLCNECTNQPPCSPPFWRTLSRFAFRSFASLRVYFPLFLSPFIHTHTHTHGQLLSCSGSRERFSNRLQCKRAA